MRLVRLSMLALVGLGAARTPSEADTFKDALAHAYSYNPDLVAAREGQRATDEKVPQALAGWRPTVKINGSTGRSTVNASTNLPLISYNQYTYGLNVQLQQPIYQGGRTGAAVTQAEDTVRAGRADLIATEQNVLLSAARAYEDVLRTRELLRLDREIERILARQVHEITLRMQAGQLTQTDVNQAATKLAAATATRLGAEGDAAAATANFIAAVGRPPQGDMAPAPSLAGLPSSSAAAVKLAETNNPTVVANQYRSRASEAAIVVARADFLPNVSLSVQAGADQGQTVPTMRSDSYSATLNVAVPIYQGGAVNSQVRAAKETAEQARTQVQVSRRDAIQNATSAYAQWRASLEQAAQEATLVRLAAAAYDNVQREAAVGAKSTFELLGQLQDLFNARVGQVNANFNVATNAYQLLAATGRFTAVGLQLPVPIYDPLANYLKVRDSGSLLP